MNLRPSYLRMLAATAAIAAAVALAGCETEGTGYSAKALKPLSPAMLAELDRKQMPKESRILVRLFKEEAELEVWKQDTSEHFALLKTYPICRWSGELGPKTKEGDRQAPEGFYIITPGQLNPNSHYYLSFDIGYPNAFDRAYGRTGSDVMVHGDCSSRGCYAMTDEQISEIYALARESFFGGQRSFQVQAYPFRMTPLNMARHRNNPNLAFWKMLKEGYDHFEVTRLEPKVDVCEKRYVFDAEAPAGATAASAPLNFNPVGRCPAYVVPQEIAEAVAEKTKQDETETAELISRGTPVAPVRTGTDGATNAAFLTRMRPQTIREADGTVHTYMEPRTPSILDLLTRSNAAPADMTTGTTAAVSETPASPPPPKAAATATAAAPATVQASTGNLFTNLFRHGGEDKKPEPLTAEQTATPPLPAKRAVARTAPAAAPVTPQPIATAAAVPPVAKPRPQQQPPAQQEAHQDEANVHASAATAASPGLIIGSQPVMPTGSFDSRWSAIR